MYRAKVQYLLRNHRERLLSAAPSVFSLVMRLACKIQSEVIEANVLYRSYLGRQSRDRFLGQFADMGVLPQAGVPCCHRDAGRPVGVMRLRINGVEAAGGISKLSIAFAAASGSISPRSPTGDKA